jgi:citrate lyase beta subunit
MSELYRSILFMPGSNPRVIEKARSLDADVIVFDLEDATAPEAKVEARSLVCKALEEGGFGRSRLVVRVNGLTTKWWQDDMKVVCATKPEAIIVPKISNEGDVLSATSAMVHEGGDGIALWAMLETPLAFLNAGQIAAADPRLECLVVGTNDLVKDLRAKHVADRSSVMMALGTAVMAARAYGLMAIDGVYNDFKDDKGLETHAIQARNMGYDGKSLIHPNQIATVNEVFSPNDAEIEEARALITAFKEAKELKKGVATFNGKMIEELHVVEAERVLEIANTLGKG